MASTLLKTKFYIPPARPGTAPRPHLIERLNEGLSRPLTLVSAPAGFGKTTRLSEWVAHRTPNARVAWLSLDESDNDLRASVNVATIFGAKASASSRRSSFCTSGAKS
ncbi:MAG TPA: hypothetical protein VJL59_19645 [Anaerolineales bacterium]|nr:hypothetical protein [Anaerolineales bacterium]